MPFFSSLFGGNSSNSRTYQPSSSSSSPGRLTKARSPLSAPPRPSMSARTSYEIPQPSFKPSSRRTHSFGSSSSHSSQLSFAAPSVGTNEFGVRKPHVSFVTPGTVTITTSNSSSSLYSLPSNSSRARYAEPRPALKQNMSWQGSVYPNNALSSVKMHHTIAYSRRRPTVVYNILHAPNHTNVLDPTTHAPISSHTLNLPATSPPTPELTLTSPYLPWPITVTSSTSQDHAITNLDVLQAVHAALRVPVSRQEWELLGSGSKNQRRVADAYEHRCQDCGGDWSNGVRRSDWLNGRTVFFGVDAQADGSHKLVLGR